MFSLPTSSFYLLFSHLTSPSHLTPPHNRPPILVAHSVRQKLPDNLKSQFRPFATLAPDLCHIGELLFRINGFRDTRQLARKVIELHALCGDHLSTGSQHELTARTMKSIVKLAKSIRHGDGGNNGSRAHPTTMSEPEIVLQACRLVNRSKTIAGDLARFDGMCAQVFGPAPTVDDASDAERLDALIDRCLHRRKLRVTASVRHKVRQMHAMLPIRSGIVCIGAAMTGKTVGWQLLADVLKEMRAADGGKGSPTPADVAHRIINPKSISTDQLYGHYDGVTREWCAGALEMVFGEMVAATGGPGQSTGWIIFDGIIDPLWIERLHTLLDDNRKLCLASGQVLERTPHMSFLFETNDVTFASPATLARCGIVHFDDGDRAERWRCAHSSFVGRLPELGVTDVYASLYECLVDWLMPAVLAILIDCKAIVDVSSMQQYSVCVECCQTWWPYAWPRVIDGGAADLLIRHGYGFVADFQSIFPELRTRSAAIESSVVPADVFVRAGVGVWVDAYRLSLSFLYST